MTTHALSPKGGGRGSDESALKAPSVHLLSINCVFLCAWYLVCSTQINFITLVCLQPYPSSVNISVFVLTCVCFSACLK